MAAYNGSKGIVAVGRSLAIRQIQRYHKPVPFILTSSQSTEAQTEKIKLPPNLKIDPRAINSKFSPFKKAQKILLRDEADNEEDLDDSDEEPEMEESDYDDTDIEEEDVDFFFETPIPAYTVPLPERLEVDIVKKSDFSTVVGKCTLPAMLFGQDPIRIDIVKRVVVYQRNKKRGKRTAKTKTISEVSGSGRKVRKQKGGGIARAGHSRPAHWRGGAKAHGPKGIIQDYTTKLNKHVRKLGLVHTLSQKLKEGNLIVVNDLMIESHKTKALSRSLLPILPDTRRSSLLMVDWASEDEAGVMGNLPVHLIVASGNIPRVKVLSQGWVNVYDLLKHEKCVITLSAIKALEERLDGVAY
eukprot:CAMPEP_0194232030 /NCGR_PEP_ID=MMETSP0158-20130606/555_1 /TAXON_ID=33649 /ORGANISM="Thalassionema nitzschioides, Strain L26-B" /LENGTH=355 /DNA_ID=CAMNT_0038964741 /DNA_START=33 /DNA_END=1100 /DNA_ORIENTATION=+